MVCPDVQVLLGMDLSVGQPCLHIHQLVQGGVFTGCAPQFGEVGQDRVAIIEHIFGHESCMKVPAYNFVAE